MCGEHHEVALGDGGPAYAPVVSPICFRRRPRGGLDALGPTSRAELLRVLMLPDFERADRIEEFWLPGESHLRRAPDRLRGGPDASSGAHRHVARGRALQQ
jgi:hypothetical protein